MWGEGRSVSAVSLYFRDCTVQVKLILVVAVERVRARPARDVKLQ
jgi:hypothetical protein